MVCARTSCRRALSRAHSLDSSCVRSLFLNIKRKVLKREERIGYILSPDGLHTDPEKVRAVASFPVSTSVESLRFFLGLAGYCRCFISRFSQIAAPLTELLKQDAPWVW